MKYWDLSRFVIHLMAPTLVRSQAALRGVVRMKGPSVIGTRGIRRSSSPPRRWGGTGAVLGGVLFAVWGYLHTDIASPQLDAIADVLGLVVPLLFLVGLLGYHAWIRGRASGSLGRIGFAFAFGGAGLGIAYRLLDVAGIASTADRYGYVVGKGLPPQLFDWFPWLLVGLTLIGMAYVRTGSLEGWASLPLAMGWFGWTYYISESGGIVQVRAIHVLFGLLFSLSWIGLGCLLWARETAERTGASRREPVSTHRGPSRNA